MAASIVAFICIYVAGFAWSWGPLAWLVPSEIHSSDTRSAGMGISTFTNFIFTFIIGQCFLSMLCSMTWGVFIFFAGFVIMMTLFVIFCVPETRGVPVEEVDELLIRKHWLWSRVTGGAQSEADAEFAIEVAAAKEDSASSFAVGRVKSSATDVYVKKSQV